MSEQPSGIVCSVCGNLFREPASEAAAIALRDALLRMPVAAQAMLGEEPSSAPGGVCNECYKRILKWARDFGLRE